MSLMAEIIRQLQGVLDAPNVCPGAGSVPAHSDMALNPDTPFMRRQLIRPAAVLVPLVWRESGWQIMLTRRTDEMPTHAGQVSFPGGGQNANDVSLLETALREFGEETGIDPAQVEVLGRFETWGTVTGFDIHPFVGVVRDPVQPRPDPREVAEVFEIPLSFAVVPDNFHRESRDWQGKARYFHVLPWKDYFIWGATAGMLRCLAERVQAAGLLSARN